MKPNDEFADIIEWRVQKTSDGHMYLNHIPCNGPAHRSGGMMEGVWLCYKCFEMAPKQMCNVADLMCEPFRKKRERSTWDELGVVKGLSWGKK